MGVLFFVCCLVLVTTAGVLVILLEIVSMTRAT